MPAIFLFVLVDFIEHKNLPRITRKQGIHTGFSDSDSNFIRDIDHIRAICGGFRIRGYACIVIGSVASRRCQAWANVFSSEL